MLVKILKEQYSKRLSSDFYTQQVLLDGKPIKWNALEYELEEDYGIEISDRGLLETRVREYALDNPVSKPKDEILEAYDELLYFSPTQMLLPTAGTAVFGRADDARDALFELFIYTLVDRVFRPGVGRACMLSLCGQCTVEDRVWLAKMLSLGYYEAIEPDQGTHGQVRELINRNLVVGVTQKNRSEYPLLDWMLAKPSKAVFVGVCEYPEYWDSRNFLIKVTSPIDFGWLNDNLLRLYAEAYSLRLSGEFQPYLSASNYEKWKLAWEQHKYGRRF